MVRTHHTHESRSKVLRVVLAKPQYGTPNAGAIGLVSSITGISRYRYANPIVHSVKAIEEIVPRSFLAGWSNIQQKPRC
ncbi:hypothetical protein NMY22_g17540 [Coprinellus aureogranulatus]|nr:hypothetical protein NMY22_g17540 [Coprinellus aureogranulatus]